MENWDAIIREHGPMALKAAWRLLRHEADTEDAFQEALYDALQMADTATVENWGGLLRRLVCRRAVDRLRRRRPVEALAPTTPATTAQPDAVAMQRELAQQLRIAIARLPDREAMVFSLKYFGELTNAGIGDSLEISTEAVAVALHKARKKLKQYLDVENCPERNTDHDTVQR